MALSIRTNYSSLNAQRNLSASQTDVDNSMRKLSSGYRITRAADDAAGLAISEKLGAKVAGTNQAIRNANDGISLIQTAEGGLAEIGNIVQRMRELAVQGSTGTLVIADHDAIMKEISALKSEVNSITTRTNFNSIKVLDGATTSLDLQIGSDQTQTMTITLSNFQLSTGPTATSKIANLQTQLATYLALSSGGGGTAATAQAAAQTLITEADTALAAINSKRADFGAMQNRLDHAIAVQQVASENMANAQSRIRDVDVAAETAKMSKSNILMQAGVSVLAQANQLPQLALKLLA